MIGRLGGWSRPRLAWLASPHLLLSLAVLFWAGNFTIGRAARDIIPPVALNFWRWSLALLILLPFALPEVIRHRAVIRREWRILLALGACGITVFHTAIYTGLSMTPAITGVIYQATSPLFIVLFSWLLLRERIGPGQALGFVLSLAGAVLVSARGDVSSLLAQGIAAGDLWLLAAMPSWALYSVLLRRRPADLPPQALLVAVVSAALLLLAPFYALELASGRRVRLGVEAVASLAYVSVFASVIAFLFWNHGVARIGANRAGVYIQLMPIFGALLAMLFLGERMAGYHWQGAVLVLVGLVLAQRPR